MTKEEESRVTSSLALAASRPLLQAVVRCLARSLDTSQLAAATLLLHLNRYQSSAAGD